MSVYLRAKTKAGGKKSLYLDIYDNNTGKRYYEFLKVDIVKAKTKEQTALNKQKWELAESIRAKKELELQANEYNYQPSYRKNINFIEYYEKQVNHYQYKDNRIMKYSFVHFKEFIRTKGYGDSINTKLVTEDLCKEFREYLMKVVNGETIINYFTKFKKVIRQAYKDKIFNTNPAEDIKNVKSEGLKKDILNYDEIKKLADTPCVNDNVRRAFLFSLNTGLRWIDVKELKWSNIDNSQIKITQAKTKHVSKNSQLIMDLNITAKKLIGERGKPNELVFTLPSHSRCLRDLDIWVKRSGIDKHITWHCARHSFAVNLLSPDVAGADIKTVSELLGHSDLKHTTKYLHVVSALKKKAVNSLPEIEL